MEDRRKCVGCGIEGDTQCWCTQCRKEHLRNARDNSQLDTMRLDWLDKNPKIILRSGKQHIRPLIDAAMLKEMEEDPRDE